MKRKNIYEAAQAVAGDRRPGRMNFEDLESIFAVMDRGAVTDAVLMAYDAGYYRGVVAARRGQYIPNQGRKRNTTKNAT